MVWRFELWSSRFLQNIDWYWSVKLQHTEHWLILKCQTTTHTHNPENHKMKLQIILFFQMKPTRCTLLLSIFISTSLHVSGNYVPIIRRNCIYATLVFFTLEQEDSYCLSWFGLGARHFITWLRIPGVCCIVALCVFVFLHAGISVLDLACSR